MRESLKKYPEEALRKKLEEFGLDRESHKLTSLREILGTHFKGSLDKALNNVNVAAEILIYMHQKKILSLKKEKKS